MNLCYFHHCIPVHDSRIILNLIKKKKYTITLVSFYYSKINFINIPTIHYSLPKNILSFSLSILLSKRIFNKYNWDVILATYLTTYGFYAALNTKDPLVINTMGSDVFINSKNLILKKINRYSIKKAKKVIVDSYSGKKILLQLGTQKEKIEKIHWGVNLDLFSPTIQNNNFHNNWRNSRIVIYTRGFKTIYGIEYLLKAIPIVVKKFPDTKFLLLGKGELSIYYKQLIINNKIEKNVEIIGFIPNNILPHYLKMAEIYVSPSLSDGSSVSLLEAMAVGLPTVVTDVPAIMEWVDDIIVPRYNSELLANGICRLLEDDTFKKELGKRNLAIAKKKANINWSITQLENVLQSVSHR